MKKFYQDAEVKLIRLSAMDIILTSGTVDDGVGGGSSEEEFPDLG